MSELDESRIYYLGLKTNNVSLSKFESFTLHEKCLTRECSDEENDVGQESVLVGHNEHLCIFGC